MEIRSTLLRNSRKLKNVSDMKGIYIKPDLTVKERELEKTHINELKMRKLAGEKVFIRNGKVVSSENMPILAQNPTPPPTALKNIIEISYPHLLNYLLQIQHP